MIGLPSSNQASDSAWRIGVRTVKRSFLAAAVAASLGLAGPALAGTMQVPIKTLWYPQDPNIPAYTTADVIQGFDSAPIPGPAGTQYVPETGPNFSEQIKLQGNGTGNAKVTLYNTSNHTTPQANQGLTDNYIGIIGGADYIINFVTGVQFFSFVFNNLDNNDTLTLTFADGSTKTMTAQDILNGGQIIGVKNSDIPDTDDDWGRVAYDMLGGPPLISADFSSGSGEWFIDSIAWALPEPGTWAMMILGFGLAGWQLRKRRGEGARLAVA